MDYIFLVILETAQAIFQKMTENARSLRRKKSKREERLTEETQSNHGGTQ
jgi:hypothetical protein